MNDFVRKASNAPPGEIENLAACLVLSTEPGETKHAAAIVLCGGQSRRMGQPKPWLPFGDELLLPRVVRLVREAWPRDYPPRIILVAQPSQSLPPVEQVELAFDRHAERGPIEGLAVGLRAISQTATRALVVSCDAALLAPGLVRVLFESLSDADLAWPEHDGRLHPLCGVYRTSIAGRLETLVAAGARRLIDLPEQFSLVRVAAEKLRAVDPELRSLWPLNTAEEYRAALAAAGVSKWPDVGKN